MKLFTRERGSGDRYAVLVHGMMSDSRYWRRLTPVLVERGYHVVAVDLPGHGQSARAKRYSVPLLVDSLIESVPAQPELVLGHSLGGLTINLAAPVLQPKRAVYLDPAFSSPKLTWLQRRMAPAAERRLLKSTAEQIASRNPRWDAEDVEIEAESFGQFDRRMFPLLLAKGGLRAPTSMEVPSLVVLAENSSLVDTELAQHLTETGFVVRVVAGTSHTLDRDDFDAFMQSLDGWV
ncbi:MAG: alpha/beta fold hydrolase [Microbacteriaceae bacterium]